MTHAAHSHAALEKHDAIDRLIHAADDLRDLAKLAQQREALITEAKLLLALQDDLLRKANWHHSYHQQVAGVRKLVRQFLNG